ncbi:MAG: adenylyl-sulfate kinase [Moraxellaceae bacterium]|nr:MAG: adenylyl-sulfate kinase [Moraxellaceae bacterium]
MALMHTHAAKVFWFSGLSGAGKTTWAEYLKRYLTAQGFAVCLLDGDMLRRGLSKDLGYSLADREENVRRACEVAQCLVKQGITVVAAFMTPTPACRQIIKNTFSSALVQEIYCQCSIDACEVRDPKGFYQRARLDNVRQVVGWDLPFIIPKNPPLVLDTEHHSMPHNQALLRQFITRCYFYDSACESVCEVAHESIFNRLVRP